MEKPWDKFDPEWGPRENLLLERPQVEDQLEADWRALRGREPGDDPIPRMSDEKLRDFVVGVLNGSLYTSAQIRDPSLIPMVFLPVALGAFKDWSEDQLKEIGVIYAPMTSAMPRSVNGEPIFAEMRIMHREDWARAYKAICRESARQKDIEI